MWEAKTCGEGEGGELYEKRTRWSLYPNIRAPKLLHDFAPSRVENYGQLRDDLSPGRSLVVWDVEACCVRRGALHRSELKLPST